MAINKVEYGGNTLIDITDTTATSGDVMSGEVFYNADGTRGVGTLSMGNAKNYYGTCSTSASTQAKVVACSGFVLEEGATIDIKFSNKQTYNGTPTLNINSTGAISITNGLKGMWSAGDIVRFVYDGTTYRTVSMVLGGTATYGAVMLSTDLTSTATNLAATISTVHQAYNLADSKQDAITSTNKLDYSLIDNTPTIPTNSNIVDLIYPVGSIYMSVNSTSPETLFGGTWVQLEDQFLLGAGTTYTNGATGGSATHTLTTDELPAHTHGSKSLSGNITIRAIDSVTSNNANLLQQNSGIITRSNDSNVAGYRSSNSNYRTSQSNQNNKITVDATHEHTSVGNGDAFSTMPPYLVVYMWKRTA